MRWLTFAVLAAHVLGGLGDYVTKLPSISDVTFALKNLLAFSAKRTEDERLEELISSQSFDLDALVDLDKVITERLKIKVDAADFVADGDFHFHDAAANPKEAKLCAGRVAGIVNSLRSKILETEAAMSTHLSKMPSSEDATDFVMLQDTWCGVATGKDAVLTGMAIGIDPLHDLEQEARYLLQSANGQEIGGAWQFDASNQEVPAACVKACRASDNCVSFNVKLASGNSDRKECSFLRRVARTERVGKTSCFLRRYNDFLAMSTSAVDEWLNTWFKTKPKYKECVGKLGTGSILAATPRVLIQKRCNTEVQCEADKLTEKDALELRCKIDVELEGFRDEVDHPDRNCQSDQITPWQTLLARASTLLTITSGVTGSWKSPLTLLGLVDDIAQSQPIKADNFISADQRIGQIGNVLQVLNTAEDTLQGKNVPTNLRSLFTTYRTFALPALATPVFGVSAAMDIASIINGITLFYHLHKVTLWDSCKEVLNLLEGKVADKLQATDETELSSEDWPSLSPYIKQLMNLADNDWLSTYIEQASYDELAQVLAKPEEAWALEFSGDAFALENYLSLDSYPGYLLLQQVGAHEAAASGAGVSNAREVAQPAPHVHEDSALLQRNKHRCRGNQAGAKGRSPPTVGREVRTAAELEVEGGGAAGEADAAKGP